MSSIAPNSLCSVSGRRLRWRRGKNLAGLIGKLLQALLQALASPFTGLGHDFLFDFDQAG